MNYEITGYDTSFIIAAILMVIMLIFSLWPRWLQRTFHPAVIQSSGITLFVFAIYFLCIGMEIVPTMIIVKNMAPFVSLASLVVSYSLWQTGTNPAYLRIRHYRFSKKIPR